MTTGDDKKWAESTDEQLLEIASKWAKKYVLRDLRAFQQSYVNHMATLGNQADSGQKTENEIDIEYRSLQNRWQTATWAIDKKTFN